MEKKNNRHNFDTRPGIKDLWNSRIVRGAEWSDYDNPVNPNMASRPVRSVVAWNTAKAIHKRMTEKNEEHYHIDAHIHFYIDDDKFDGNRGGIWAKPERFLEIAKHFDGVLGIDFSTNADFPDPVKRDQVYCIRAMEYYASVNEVEVIQNARWGASNTWGYFFDVLHHHVPLSIGTVGSGINLLKNRPLFDAGIRELVRVCEPSCLYVVGSASYPVFGELEEKGVVIRQFDSPTAEVFKAKVISHE